MDILALIPVRGGSKGIPRKNLLRLGGKPMMAYPIITAAQSKYINRIIVSTDDEEMAEVARQYGAEVPFMRPAQFATDISLDLEVFRHCFNWFQEHEGKLPDLVVQLRATAPIRDTEVLDQAIQFMISHPEATSMRSVSPPDFTPYKMWRVENDFLRPLLRVEGVKDWYDKPRQGLPTVYAQDGFVDIVRPSIVLQHESMSGDSILGFTHNWPVIDIDSLQEVEKAERLLEQKFNDLYSRIKMGRVELGIIQGRLTPSPTGALQQFPHGRWEEEFELAQKFGFDYIEWIVERKKNPDNPIWSGSGLLRAKKKSVETGVGVSAVCVDSIISTSLAEDWETVVDIITRSALLGAKKVILPCFEKTELIPGENLHLFYEPLVRCADAARMFGVEICLETTLTGRQLQVFLEELGRPEIKVCYDLGNTAFLGHNLSADIRLLRSSIRHVHIKDRTTTGENVLLGTGASDLKGAFEALLDIGYQGTLTFENTRGDDPLQTASTHRQFVLGMLNSCCFSRAHHTANV